MPLHLHAVVSIQHQSLSLFTDCCIYRFFKLANSWSVILKDEFKHVHKHMFYVNTM